MGASRSYSSGSKTISSDNFAPRAHSAMSGGIVIVTPGGVLLPASNRCKPGLLRNILQSMWWPPRQRTLLSQMSTVPCLRSLCNHTHLHRLVGNTRGFFFFLDVVLNKWYHVVYIIPCLPLSLNNKSWSFFTSAWADLPIPSISRAHSRI